MLKRVLTSVHPLTPDRMADLDTVFRARGCSVAKGCYCMYYRIEGKPDFGHGEARGARYRKQMAALAKGDVAPGLLGYIGDEPVGWVSLGPREDFKRLARSKVMAAVDAKPVWSIICFVVPSAHRRRGVAHELLRAAIEFARSHGATLVEGYPVDREVPGAPDAPWFGSCSMFEKAGFREVARYRPARAIVRKAIGRRGSR